jgi:hypothetical protein
MSLVPENIQKKHDSENTIYVTQHQDLLCCQNTKLKWILLALHVKEIILVFWMYMFHTVFTTSLCQPRPEVQNPAMVFLENCRELDIVVSDLVH